MTQPHASLRPKAEQLSAALPPLLVQAKRLAQTVQMGEHGRRRAGPGEAFWQFRRTQPGDPAHRIDWRRSARSDQTFVQEKEWQAAHSVQFWADNGASMQFSSAPDLPTKADRAALLCLATAVLLAKGGEHVGLLGVGPKPARAELGVSRMADNLSRAACALEGATPTRRAQIVLVSDFLGPPDPVLSFLQRCRDNGQTGIVLQVLDPIEETFPFQGRMLLEDMAGQFEHDTHEASDLRARYLARLGERKDLLLQTARAAGWQFHTHHTGHSPSAALLWLSAALAGRL